MAPNQHLYCKSTGGETSKLCHGMLVNTGCVLLRAVFGLKGMKPFEFSDPLAVAYFPQGVAPSVSSALGRFTSVFGMGTGGATPL